MGEAYRQARLRHRGDGGRGAKRDVTTRLGAGSCCESNQGEEGDGGDGAHDSERV